MLQITNEEKSKIQERRIVAEFPIPKGSIKKAIPFLKTGHTLYDCDLKLGTISPVVVDDQYIMYMGKFVQAYTAKPGHLYFPSLNEKNVLKKLQKAMKNIFGTEVNELS